MQPRVGHLPVGAVVEGEKLAFHGFILLHGGRQQPTLLTVNGPPSRPTLTGWLRFQPTGGTAILGHGQLGMSERVSVWGGSLTTGKRLGGGYRVAARLPYGNQDQQ